MNNVTALRKPISLESRAVLKADELYVGRTLLFHGIGYDDPEPFQVTGIYKGRALRKHSQPGVSVENVLLDRVLLESQEERRVLTAVYLVGSAKWQVVD